MTIKKPMQAAEAETVVTPVTTGGATIADRFKLDVPDPNAKKPTGVGTILAVVAGFLALAVAGILTFVLYTHLEFLQNA